jgi:hypothetical protein
MIPLLLFFRCGTPVEPAWEVEVFAQAERPENPAALTAKQPESIGTTQWQDTDTTLSLAIPEGWLAWPGAPGGAVRLHMEHNESGVLVRVFASDSTVDWPSSNSCEWRPGESGFSAGLRVGATLSFSACWPDVPGNGRKLAWRFVQTGRAWLIEARLPGGQAGIGGQALEVLLPAFNF